MFGLGAQEVLIVLAIGVLLFGSKLPELGRSLGRGIMEFKKGVQGVEDELT
jgi:sec-independent protein translocase protein TatA